jgi:hypothetical protein
MSTDRKNKPAKAAEAAKAAKTEATLADQIEGVCLDLLGAANEKHADKNRVIDEVVDVLGSIAPEARALQAELAKTAEHLEVAVKGGEAKDGELAEALATAAKAVAEAKEAVDANVEFVGIEDDLNKALEELEAFKATSKEGLAAALKSAKKVVENDVMLARKQRDAAKEARRLAEQSRDRARDAMAELGIDGPLDLAAWKLRQAAATTALRAELAETWMARMERGGREWAAKLNAAKAVGDEQGDVIEAMKEQLRVLTEERDALLETTLAPTTLAPPTAAGGSKTSKAIEAMTERVRVLTERVRVLTEELGVRTDERDALLAFTLAPPTAAGGSNIDPDPKPKPGATLGVEMARRWGLLIDELVELGVGREVIEARLAVFQGVAHGAISRFVQPLIAAGIVEGSVPADMAEVAALTEAPLKLVEGGDKDEAFGVFADSLLALLDVDEEAARKAAAYDHIHTDTAGGYVASRMELDAAFGSECKVDENGLTVYGVRVPTLIGYALRRSGDKVVALAHRARIWQPYTVVVARGDGSETYTVSRIKSSRGRIVLVRPDEKVGDDAGVTVLSGRDEIVRVHRMPPIKADGLNAAQAATALAIRKGFRPGEGQMALPSGAYVVDAKGTALPGCPLVNLDMLALHLYDEAADLAC